MKLDPVIIYLRSEGAGVLLVSIAAYLTIGGPVWPWFLILLPDLSMFAYSFGPRTGARVYNLAHTYLLPLLLGLLGRLTGSTVLYDLALVWTAHIGADRLFGYGLKFPDAFGNTHLGQHRPGPTTKG
jgi:Domain of unknown function (DUF4260)